MPVITLRPVATGTQIWSVLTAGTTVRSQPRKESSPTQEEVRTCRLEEDEVNSGKKRKERSLSCPVTKQIQHQVDAGHCYDET